MPEAENWTCRFRGLHELSPDDRDVLARAGHVVRLDAGAVVFAPGSACSTYLLVIDGAVRVQMVADTGREILLYRVRAGESCVLTTACLLGQELYAATGMVEAATTAVAVPQPAFAALMGRSDAFRRFVFHGFGQRLADLLATMQDAVFHRVDGRLARLLLERGRDGPVAATHQDLATDLGTAREVVSRHLKTFERDGLVTRGRGAIRVADRRGLQALAERLE